MQLDRIDENLINREATRVIRVAEHEGCSATGVVEAEGSQAGRPQGSWGLLKPKVAEQLGAYESKAPEQRGYEGRGFGRSQWLSCG